HRHRSSPPRLLTSMMFALDANVPPQHLARRERLLGLAGSRVGFLRLVRLRLREALGDEGRQVRLGVAQREERPPVPSPGRGARVGFPLRTDAAVGQVCSAATRRTTTSYRVAPDG